MCSRDKPSSIKIEELADFLNDFTQMFLNTDRIAENGVFGLINSVLTEKCKNKVSHLTDTEDGIEVDDFMEQLYLFALLVTTEVENGETNPFKRLKSIRKEVGISQTTLAVKTKTTQASISLTERGIALDCSPVKRIELLRFMLENQKP